MPSFKLQITGPGAAAGVGAGLATALLSMLVAQKTSFALAMGFIAPLPIMIAAIGFGSLAGLIALIVGAVAVGVFDMRPEGLAFVMPSRSSTSWIDVLVFVVSLGLPSWLLARLAIVKPRAPAGAAPVDVRPDEHRLARIAAVAIGFASVGVALDFIVAMSRAGGFKAFMAATVAKLEPVVTSILTANRPLPKGLSVHDIAVGVTWAQMPLMAGADVVLLVFNLWLAARIAQTSNLLNGTWPDIPAHLRVPRALAPVLAVALGLSFAGGIVGIVSLIVSGALITGFALQGLAVIHAVTRGKTFRLPLLIIVYLSMALLMPWLAMLYGLVGLIDTALNFRDREKPRPKPQGPPKGPWHRPPENP